LAKGVEVAAVLVTKEQAVDALYLLAKETPVDQAIARSNWRVGVGRPVSGVVAPFRAFPSRHKPPYGAGGSKGERSNLNAVVAAAKSRLSRYSKGSIYLSNNVKYIGPLDRGWSPQTPSGFVARAVMASIGKTAPKIKKIFDKEFSK
jgi:hypothetical protein